MITVRNLKYWLFQPVDRVVLQVPRALLASVLSALLDCATMVFLVEVCSWQPLSSAIFSYLLGGVLQYVLCSVWVFPNSPSNKAASFLTFTVLSLGGLGITWGVMAVGARLLVPYGLAKVLALGLAFVWNFTSRKVLLFRKSPTPDRQELEAEQFNTPRDYNSWMATMAASNNVRQQKSRRLGLPGKAV